MTRLKNEYRCLSEDELGDTSSVFAGFSKVLTEVILGLHEVPS